ncbi:hypothetical protein SCALM49S_02817 [Streptomyces californicus]
MYFAERSSVGLIPAVWTVVLGLWGSRGRTASGGDEKGRDLQVARRSTGDIVRMLEHVDVVHSLYYLCMHGLFAGLGRPPPSSVYQVPGPHGRAQALEAGSGQRPDASPPAAPGGPGPRPR